MTDNQLYETYKNKIDKILWKWGNKPKNFIDIREDIIQTVMLRLFKIPHGSKRTNWPYIKRVIITNISKEINKITNLNYHCAAPLEEWHKENIDNNFDLLENIEFNVTIKNILDSFSLDENIVLMLFIDKGYKNHRNAHRVMAKQIYKTEEETKEILDNALIKFRELIKKNSKKI
jgi:hypothetical protein